MEVLHLELHLLREGGGWKFYIWSYTYLGKGVDGSFTSGVTLT